MQVPNHLQLYGYQANAFQAPYVQSAPRMDMTYAILSLQQSIMNQQNTLKYYIQQQNQSLNAYNTPCRPLVQYPTQQFQPKQVEEDPRMAYFRGNQQSHYLAIKEEFGRIYRQNSQTTQVSNDEDYQFSQCRVKSEDSNVSELKENQIDACVLSSGCPTTVEESGSDDESERNEEFRVASMRRNGFKPRKVRNDDDESYEGTPRKSNKLIEPKRPPSKAKHLWINYGRKIIDYAVNQTQDEIQNRVKALVGKLSSKKDFEDVFGVNEDDTEEDKNFKTTFGKLALVFVNQKAEAAFEGSKYKDQMITQKKVVSSWISKLIKE